MERVQMWLGPPALRPDLKSDEVAGQTELHCLVQLGSEVCGHVEFVHGGFLSALFDELFGWTTFLEKDLFGKFGKGDANVQIFTANLNINYRRPVPKDATYLVKVHVERVVRDRKIYLRGALYNRAGDLLTEGTSLYIIKRY